MTLEPYDSDRLDAITLRVLDLCAGLRNLARTSREEQLPPVQLHDRKALEWLANLEGWLIQAEADLTRSGLKNRGARSAQKTHSSRPK